MAWLVLILAALALIHGSRAAELVRWKVSTAHNPAFLEGLAWWYGRLSLPYRLWDTAEVSATGEAFNVFPPLQSLIGFLATGPQQLTGQPSRLIEFHLLPLLVFGLPLPIVGFLVFRGRTNSDAWAAVLTLGWLAGTAVLPCIHEARNDGVHHINHLLSQIGLLIMAGELLGRRRMWLAAAGLIISAWSRQLTLFYYLGAAWIVWPLPLSVSPVVLDPGGQSCGGRQDDRVAAETSPPSGAEDIPTRLRNGTERPRGRLKVLAVAVGLTLAVPAVLNTLKFGSPLRSGYELIYAGRNDDLAADAARHGLFSPAFLGRNLYYLNLALPWTAADAGADAGPVLLGTSIWLTTPALVLVLIGARIWWREPAARALMLCTVPIIAALLLYHGTGQRQFGYYRFALDFVPVWLVVAAPWIASGRRRWATAVCVSWSATYFAWLARWSV